MVRHSRIALRRAAGGSVFLITAISVLMLVTILGALLAYVSYENAIAAQLALDQTTRIVSKAEAQAVRAGFYDFTPQTGFTAVNRADTLPEALQPQRLGVAGVDGSHSMFFRQNYTFNYKNNQLIVYAKVDSSNQATAYYFPISYTRMRLNTFVAVGEPWPVTDQFFD